MRALDILLKAMGGRREAEEIEFHWQRNPIPYRQGLGSNVCATEGFPIPPGIII